MTHILALGALLLSIALWTWRKPRQACVILWALVATLFTCAALLKILPGPFADNVLWYAVSVPMIWAGVQVWVYWEAKAWRVTASLIGATLVSAAVVVMAPSPV